MTGTEHGWNGRCCCNCRYHLKDMSHPCTDGESILKQRGWICSPPELEGAFSGWDEHGMCEMHEYDDSAPKPTHPKIPPRGHEHGGGTLL